ncbi:MAG: hypothetical protein KF784_00280 [Fimbriimonadaceae bacterium]|nr:hypothetical protein [Fimbriimonadaceae bacterium]
MPVYLHLRIRVLSSRLDDFHAFLSRAIPCYEQPGGIKVRLLQQDGDPESFIEVVEYETEDDYAKDQVRVEEDPQSRDLIAEWRTLLDGPPTVEVWREQTLI